MIRGSVFFFLVILHNKRRDVWKKMDAFQKRGSLFTCSANRYLSPFHTPERHMKSPAFSMKLQNFSCDFSLFRTQNRPFFSLAFGGSHGLPFTLKISTARCDIRPKFVAARTNIRPQKGRKKKKSKPIFSRLRSPLRYIFARACVYFF